MQSKIQSKVKNTKATFKLGVNEKSEALLKRSFEPLFSAKDGKARLTFCGVEHSVIEWTDNGKRLEKPILKLVFSCFDVTHESPANIAITCDYRLSEKNRLGQVLKIMGFEFQEVLESVDTDDEFGVKKIYSNPTEIFDFLRKQCGLVFKACFTVDKRKNKATGEITERPGLWDIDYKSLEPKLLKSGEHERDMLASDITDETFENPVIQMSNDSD